MAPRFSTIPPEHLDTVRPQSNRPRRRHALTGIALAAAFTLTGIATRGDVRQISAAQSAASSTGHAQVIAQAIFDLSNGPLTWSVSTIEAEAQQSDLAANGISGFALGTDGDVVIRAGANARTQLAGGEALAVRPGDNLTVQAAGDDQGSLSLLTLSPAEPTGPGNASQTGEVFASPGGSRDIELVGDILVENETVEIPAAAAPIFVLVTEGSLAIVGDDDETWVVQAGETALVPSDLVATGETEEPTRFVAAVIGADLGEEPDSDPDSSPATPDAKNPIPRPSPSPRPSPRPSASPKPSASPSPSPSPSPTPDGEGPDDDPDNDGLVNEREDALGTDRHDPDTDYDLLTDGEEYHTYLSNPKSRDTDADGLYDGDEVIRVGSDPIKHDTDGEGLNDGREVNELFTNALAADTDDDGLSDYEEVMTLPTNPRLADTDADGIGDWDELRLTLTNPVAYDTDGDNYGDGEEISVYNTDPKKADTDDDGLNDAEELFLTTDPRNPDSDGDGYTDGAEIYEHRTWPLDPESHP